MELNDRGILFSISSVFVFTEMVVILQDERDLF